MRLTRYILVLGFSVLMGSSVSVAQWSTAQNVNTAESGYGHMKYPSVWAATGGGFHVKYNLNIENNVPADWQLKYRRYQASAWGSPVVVHSGNMVSGGEICEALNGSIHIVWENWGSTGNVGWSQSTNGGLSFTSPIEIAPNLSDVGKFPRIAPFGTNGSAELVAFYGYPPEHKTFYSRFTGSMWLPAVNTGQNYGTEHELSGIAWSPVDGSVYATVDNDDYIAYQRFDGTTWTTTNVESQGAVPRPCIAVNANGRIMVVWENNTQLKSKLYIPGSGWGAVQIIASPGAYSSVAAIPGTDNFYVIYSVDHPPYGTNIYEGRLWSNGAWGTVETVSVGIPRAYSVNSDLAAAADGSLMAVWEDHGASTARVMYSIRPGSPAGPTGTLSGVVRDQLGSGIPNVLITTSGSTSGLSGERGVYSMSVPPGLYYVSAAKSGYSGTTASQVSISSGQTTSLNLTITAQVPGKMSSFTVTPDTTRNTISWQNSTTGAYTGTRILFKASSYPAHPDDGTLLMEQVTGLGGSTGQYVQTGLVNGQPCYYAAFPYFEDVNRFYGPPAFRGGTPAVRVDYDRDGDVDQSDYGAFQRCYSGPYVAQSDPACQSRKLDGDDDVDTDDLSVFLNCFAGVGVYANPLCAN